MGQSGKVTTPLLFPVDPEQFLEMVRAIVKEELEKYGGQQLPAGETVNGLTYKPLYKMDEVCRMFNISTTTIYDWISKGRLKPKKVRSRVYFLWKDLQELMKGDEIEV